MVASPEEWTAFWSQGHQHSCPTSFDGFYGEATQLFWRQVAKSLEGKGRCVDLCCGPGALLGFLRREAGSGVDFDYVGVDAAALPGGGELHSAGVRLLEKTDVTKTGLEAGSVTTVVSQYGVEYVTQHLLTEEVDRICASRATLAFVLHHAESQVVEVGRDELSVCAEAVAVDGVLALAQRLLPLLAQSRTAEGRRRLSENSEAMTIKRRYNEAVDSFLSFGDTLKHGAFVHDVMNAVMKVLGSAHPTSLSEGESRIGALRVDLQNHRLRLAAMLDAAHDSASLERFRMALQQCGFQTRAGELRENNYLMAWTLLGSR